MAFKLRPYQQEAVNKVVEHVKICLDPCVVDAATGCHAYGHDIMMSDGTKKQVQDIIVGDEVMGPDGKPRQVVRLVRGQDEMFRVTPTKGESFVVNGGHMLSLYQTPRISGQAHGYTEISVNEYIGSSSTFKHRSKLQRFGFDLPSKNLPIPPYVLGLLLGDGCITGVGQMTFTSQDHAAITAIESYLLSIGASNRLYFDGREAVGVCFKDYHQLEEHLTELGLHGCDSGNKFIPGEYLTSSNEDALEMIAGLIDTDGSLCPHGVYDYISKSKELSEGLVYLCRRAGLAAYMSECEKGCQNRFKGTYYRVCVSGDLSKIPCRVSHKKCIFDRKQKKRVDVTGFKVESIGLGDYYGFTVDGDHLYLDGDFVRHRNCGKSVIIAEIAKFFNEVSGKKTLVIGPNKEICQQNADKYKSYGFPASFWSASIGKKEMRHQVVFGSPVSIKNELDKFGPQFGAVIIDEAHLLSPTVKEICSHMKEQNNLLRIVGLTATPYRLGSGYIYEYDENNNPVGDECTKNPFFKRLVYRITAKELIDQGFLTPPIADHEMASKYDTSGVQLNKRNQFDAKDIERAFEGQGRLTAQIIADVVSHCQNKMCCMIFAATIQHAQEIMESLPKHNSYCVTGKTKRKDREKAIERAKTGEIKYLVSVGTLTTGVDITNVDVIAILRATESASLLQQIIGRC